MFSLATPVARCCSSTTPSRATSSRTSWRVTSRAPSTWRTATRARPERVGVALVTSGPALTNAITGIATAYSDSIPMVVFSGQVAAAGDRKRRVPGSGQRGSHAPGHQAQLPGEGRPRPGPPPSRRPSTSPRTGRPGRCWSTSRRTSAITSASFTIPKRGLTSRHYQPRYEGHWGQIKKALALITPGPPPAGLLRRRRDPVRRCRRAAPPSWRSCGLPATYTLMGIGGIPGDHPLSLGMLGMHGTYRANMADGRVRRARRHRCALRRPRDGQARRVQPAARGRSTSTSIPTSIRKTVHVDIPIVGDVRNCLAEVPEAPRRRARLSTRFYERTDRPGGPQIAGVGPRSARSPTHSTRTARSCPST